MQEAEVLFTKILLRTQTRFGIIHSFRRVAFLGLPYAKPLVSKEWERFSDELANDGDFERLFVDNKELFKRIGGLGGFSRMLTDHSVENYEIAVDAASLVFAHSILDDAALDYCRVTNLVSPADWEPFIQKRKLSLEELKGVPYDEILTREVNEYLGELERNSLLKKIDRILQICKPPEGFSPMSHYKFNRNRLEQLDELRHGIVHGEGLVRRLPSGEDDIMYLEYTNMFLLILINHKCGIKLNPYLMEVYSPASTES